MVSLACQRAGGNCIGSGLARMHHHEPLAAGSAAMAAILELPECSSPRLRSFCAVNDRNGVLLGNVSATAGVEGRRFTTSACAHEVGASLCVSQETAQLPQRSEGVLRNHLSSGAAQWPEDIKRAQDVGGEASTLHDPQAMDEDTASTNFFSGSSNSDDEELSSDSSYEGLSEAGTSPQHVEGPLDCLTALCEALPAKRGLSRHFAGKSQSFACLADVRAVADLAKPLNPYVKRRKIGSSVGNEACHRPRGLPASSISKRPVNSHRKAYHVVTVPKSIPQGITHATATDYYISNSIPLKCFSAPELGVAGL